MRKAFVTGANGFIGSALVRRLLRDGVAVRAMCRDPQRGSSRALAEAGAEVMGGDVQDLVRVRSQIQGCDVVFHGAAVASGSAARQYNVNAVGTRHVFQAARKAGVERFVHVSTVAVYGFGTHGSIDEDHPQRPSRDDFYQQTKALGEAAIWELSRRDGLPAVSIRPAMVYGPGSTFWSRQLFEICRRIPMPLVDGGHGHAHPIFIDDVVDLLVTAATHPAAPGHAFHAAPDPAPTWAEFAGYYAAMADNTARFEIPMGAARLVGVVLTALARWQGRPLDVSGGLKFMGQRATFRMTRAAQILNWQPRTSLQQGMRLTEPWLKQ